MIDFLKLFGILALIVLILSLVSTEQKERTKGQTILATTMLELGKNDEKIVDRVSEIETHVKELEILRVNLNRLIEEKQKEREASLKLNQAIDDAKEMKR